MNSYQAKAPSDKEPRSVLFTTIAVSVGAFVVGAVLTFFYVQWNAQKQQLAMMTEMVKQMGQNQTPPPVMQVADTVTRAEPIDLLALATADTQPVPAAPQQPVAPAPVASAAPAEVPTAPETQPQVAAAPELSTAEKLRAIVQASTTPTTTLDEKRIADARRLETLAVIHAGVEELVAAVVEGKYDIHTDYEDEDFSGRIHFAFVGHEEDQKELERYLANAAEAGVVAHSNAVVDGNGRVNGHILLFDLVERALENGTLEEQRAGQEMRQKAVAMLAKDKTVGQAANDAGERFYTVEAGDSLAYIALQFYGNTNSYELIYQANRSQLRTPDRIRVGQRLLIPNA